MQGKKGKLKQQKQMPNTKCKMPNRKCLMEKPNAKFHTQLVHKQPGSPN